MTNPTPPADTGGTTTPATKGWTAQSQNGETVYESPDGEITTENTEFVEQRVDARPNAQSQEVR